jgi:phosphate butyryltransferase
VIRTFDELYQAVKKGTPAVIAVVGGDNDDSVEFALLAEREGLARCVFVGDETAIGAVFAQHGKPETATILHATDDESAAAAVRLCTEGKAHFVLKGKVKTNQLLSAVLKAGREEIKDRGMYLSHVTVVENPRMKKLLIISDGGMSVLPNLQQKIWIMQNAIKVAHSLGVAKPKVILAAAMEDTGQEFPAIADAREIVKRHKAGEWPDAIIDGPFGVDVGLEPNAAKEKKIDTPIAGDVDIIIVPNIEAGNVGLKLVLYYQEAMMLGLVVGGVAPILLVSRAHPPRSKLLSAALAKIYVGN